VAFPRGDRRSRGRATPTRGRGVAASPRGAVPPSRNAMAGKSPVAGGSKPVRFRADAATWLALSAGSDRCPAWQRMGVRTETLTSLNNRLVEAPATLAHRFGLSKATRKRFCVGHPLCQQWPAQWVRRVGLGVPAVPTRAFGIRFDRSETCPL
jgi:hypothetical protein